MLFFGVLILIFLQVIRPQDFVPGLEGAPLVWYSMLVCLTLLLFSPVEKKLLRAPQDRSVGIFFIIVTLSTLSLFWISQIIEVTSYAVKFALMYYFVVMVVLDDGKLKIAIWTMVVLMAIVALMGVLQYHGYDITGGGMSWAPDKNIWQIRGIGNFDNPNDMAYSVVLVVPFSLGLLLQGKGFFSRISALALFTVGVYCIYLTRSRGGQLAFGTALVTWAFFWARDPKWRRRILVISATFLFVLFAVQTSGFRKDDSAMGRVEAWSAGWEMVKGNPLIGVGKDNFREHHQRDSHSSYVRAASELGLLGLYVFVGVLYYSAITIYSAWEKSDAEKWRIYYCGFAAYINSYIVASAFSTRTYDLIFLLCVALIGIMGRLSLEETGQVSSDGVLFKNAPIINKNVFGLTSLVLFVWYIFLRRAY